MDGQPPSPPPVPTIPIPKTSGYAIASLVLGILGVMCLLPVVGAILALIFGLIALTKISGSRGTVGGQGMAVAGVVLGGIGLVMIPIMAGMLLPALASAREKARRAVCMNNERQIYLACMTYAQNHNQTWPHKLEDVRQYVASEKVFHCPSAPDSSGPSYILIPHDSTNPNGAILRENPADHRGVVGNVAYADGRVSWEHAQNQGQ